MASNVDEARTAKLVSFLGGSLTFDDAAKLLQIMNNDIEAAANKYFDFSDNNERLQDFLRQSETGWGGGAGWDNSAFATDRYGQHDGVEGIPSFNIELPPDFDHYPHSGGPSGAPSRPPSRTSQHSRGSANAGDAPVQSIENGQESGVIGGSGQYFGPATKEYYDSSQWAVVPTSTNTEFLPEVPPLFRSRDLGQPAFVRPLPADDYLPALLTILHSIPLYRNAFLAPQVSQEDYWISDEWWNGNASGPARTVDNGHDAAASQDLDILYETQRIMAALDKTNRAYVAVTNLLKLDAWKESSHQPDGPTDNVLKFLLVWESAYEKAVPDVVVDGVLRSSINVCGARQDSFLLDATVVHDGSNLNVTLYDVLDQTLFATPSSLAHIVNISNVLIIRLTASTTTATVNCKIPAILYADRYLEKNKDVINAMMEERQACETTLMNLDRQVEKIKYHATRKTPHLQKMETLKLLETSMDAFMPAHGGMIEDPKNAAVLAQLKSLYENIERKLSSLEELKKTAQATLKNISNRFKAPIDANTGGEVTQDATTQYNFSHPYKLWGVSTSPRVFYVRHPKENPQPPESDQWWRIEYTSEGSDAGLERSEITLDHVLASAGSDSGTALLVYANDAATSVEPVALPPALEAFVKKDNMSFEQELRDLITREDQWAEASKDNGTKVNGSWMDQDEGYLDNDWNQAKDFAEQADSGISSTTLTPDTEIDDEGVGMVEMQEVNGGIDAWAGMTSTASSDTVGEPMDIGESSQSEGVVNYADVEMVDAEAVQDRGRGGVEHIEVVEEKKGG